MHGDSSSIRLVRDVAPNVSLLNLRVLDGSGSGIDSAVIAGIQRAIQLKSQYSIRVTNLSYLLNKPGGGRSGRFPRRTEIHRFGSLFDQFRQ